MIRKQMAQALNEMLNYAFNWNEFTIKQILFSGMLTLLFVRSLLAAMTNIIWNGIACIKKTLQQAREQETHEGFMSFGTLFRHRHP